MASDWKRVEEVFDRVVSAPPAERPALLERWCAGDDALRAEVESLLRHDQQAPPDFLNPDLLNASRPAVSSAVSTPNEARDPLIGQSLGDFEIKRLIAAGGMGTVYEAQQQHPRRTVALKVMHGWVASPAIGRRFELEAEILGRLRHPHIAQVYQAGMHEIAGIRLPYFAMEYVPDARPITQYADQSGLNTRQRLELFVKVCDAVQHGHQHGVIHRDLKPGNILIDADGEPKVIDFGVARATDADVAMTTQCTAPGQIVGTVQYMSPEQCDGDSHRVDTRSDVYSLGVVLYELLTGALPYETTGSTIYAATRVIKEQVPARPSTRFRQAGRSGKQQGKTAGRRDRACYPAAGAPRQPGEAPGEPYMPAATLRPGHSSTAERPCPALRPDAARLARELRGDVDTIVLKALEKDREKRYASAGDLAADIRRYLNHEPILARPPTRWTRATCWVGRHPYLTTVAACLLLATLLVAATYVTVWVVNERPHRFTYMRDPGYEFLPECREARLVAFNDRTLRSWGGRERWSVKFAELVDRPRELGGGRVAIVLYHPEPSAPSELCIYDTRVSLYKPEWKAELDDGQPLPDPHRRGYTARQFNPFFAALLDVFPEHPGQELFVCHNVYAYSQCVLRIYDLRGEVLYEVWHDGGVDGAYWMADAKLLVLYGSNAEVYWEARGYPGVKENPHPHVVYAIRPRYRERHHAFLHTQPGDGPLDPAWYKCLWPPEPIASRKAPLRGGPPLLRPFRGDPRRAVQVVIGLWLDEAQSSSFAFSLGIDEHGEEIPGSRVIPDNYKRALEAAATRPGTGPPDLDRITLHDLPPINPSPDGPAAQPADPPATQSGTR